MPLFERPEEHDRRPPWLCCICNDFSLNDAYAPYEGPLQVTPAQDLGKAMGRPWIDAIALACSHGEPRPGRVLLFGSRARGDGRPDSDLDLLVVMPQATLTPQERQQALRSLRAALRPLPLSVGIDLVVVGEEDARGLAGSRWHVVARALREGKELHVAG